MYKASTTCCRLMLLGTLLTLCGCAASKGGDSARILSTASNTPQGMDKTSQAKNGATRIDRVVVSYSLAEDQVTLHEPVILNFTIENKLEQPIKFDLGPDRTRNFILTVKKPDGTTVCLRQPDREGTALVGRLSLQPGQTYTKNLLLNEWDDFSEPGKYELSVTLDNKIQTQEGESIDELAEGHATLEIKPRDAARLDQVSASLLGRILNSTSYAEAAEAALALSYIKDPVAVPYMETAATSGHMVEDIIIRGWRGLVTEKPSAR